MTAAEEAALRDEARQNPAIAQHVASLLEMELRARAIADVLARKADFGRTVAGLPFGGTGHEQA